MLHKSGGSVNLSDFKETITGSGIWTATYETTVAPGINTTNGYTFKNDVDFKLNCDPKHAQGEAIIGSTSQLITKSFDRIEGTNVLVWNVNLTLNEGITDVILTDSPDYKSSVSYIAINDPTDGEKVLYDAGVDEEHLTDYGKSITVENVFHKWEKKLAFTEAFLNEHKNTTVNFICKTTLSGNPSSNFRNNEEYTNSAGMSYKVDGIDKTVTANASYKYTTDLDKTGQVDTKENKINYTISIAVKNTGLEEGKAYTITDSIGSDFIIDAYSISGKYHDLTGNSDWIGNDVQTPSINYDAGTHTFTYTVAKDFLDIVNANPTKKYQIKIMYSAVPKDLNEFYKHEKTEVTNRAQGMYDGGDIGSAITQTTIVPKTVVNKTGTQKNTDGTQNSYATYTISVNEFGVKLNNGNSLRGVDVLNKNLIYQLSSITVKNSKTGEGLPEGNYSYSYDQENNSLTFVLPDETPITISYKASINLPIGSTMNEENSGNTFTLYGDSETTSGSSTIKLDGEFKPSVTITGENAELSIVKYDEDHIDTKLSGAKFALIEAFYNDKDHTFTEGQKTERVTGVDGRATFKGVSLDQIYILRELEAPKGYEKAAEIYCVFEGHSFSLLKKPDEHSTHKLVVFKNKSMEYPVGDKKIDEKLGSIKVTKNVEGLATGTNGPEKIEFTVTNADDRTVVRTLTVKRNDDGSYTEETADNLPLGTYTVTEGTADVAGHTLKKTTYKVGETETNSVTLTKEVSDQTVAVTNTYSKDVGKLTITKEVSGLADEDQINKPTELKFAVTGPNDYSNEVTVKLVGGTYKTVELTDLVPGEYTVTEETEGTEVTGYTLTSTTYKVGDNAVDKVTVSKDQTTAVTVTNTYSKDVGKLTFTKSFSGDALTKEQLTGISFTVKNVSTEEVVGTYSLADITNSDGSYSKMIENLPVGKYEVIETNAGVNGYTVTTTYKVNGTDSVNGAVEIAKDSENTVAITNNYIQLVSYTVKKEWNLNGTEGVVIPETITVQLTANGIPYGDPIVLHASESDTDNWTYTWDNLPKSDAAGEINYSVNEIEAPEGYTVSAVTNTESRVITLTNTYTNGKEVTFSKEDVAGKELPGATMSISVKNGEEVSRWVSTSEKNVVTLAPGNYTLTELTAPNGYLKAQSIDFTLDAEGKVLVDGNPVSEVVMVDEYASHDVIISKVDAANNKELAGAVLKVTDKEGNEVDKWTSEEGKNHTVTVKPGTYTFTEVSAPKGYELAESITFNVDLNGKVTIDGKQVTAVVMKDAKKPTNVQTGVHTNVGGFGALGGFSIGMAFIVLFLRKKMD